MCGGGLRPIYVLCISGMGGLCCCGRVPSGAVMLALLPSWGRFTALPDGAGPDAVMAGWRRLAPFLS